ncbi:PREDICTED: transcription initiation factor TFIID subunit 7-like [Galeopterus variegatus]|uniref:Transcription initiation factor TFIID subunit 7-like n=1 Tax=Galeopterus variegatus TaxID=482537 RepID=A0ABM0RQK9_GALVR|nr:PREDICTED: transcription initiation factor TFIID subunit 7-like [Galeopterus variegatus]
MNKSQDELPYELENQFILRLPPEHASAVRNVMHSRCVTMKDKLKIDLIPDGRPARVEVGDVSLTAKLVDLPCVIGSLKTVDKKTFYKTADISQMLVCTANDDIQSSPEEPETSTDPKEIKKNEKTRQKKYAWKHGITPPLKNVRKKRFRKTVKKIQCAEPADVEKEVKRLLCSDAEAVHVRWEVTGEGTTKEIQSQSSIPGFKISPGMSGYKQGHNTLGYDTLWEMFRHSSSNDDEEDKEKEEEKDEDKKDDENEDEDEEVEEEHDFEEDLERELEARFTDSGRYEAMEDASSIEMEIHKQIYYTEKKLQEIKNRAQRQKNLIMKVENLMLKNHLYSVLEQLTLQEKQKNEQLISLQGKLKCFLKK